MRPKEITIGLAATALITGAVDASVLNEQALERVETIASERVEVKQIRNVVETTFPWKDQPGIKVKYDLGEPTLVERVADKRKREVITETVNEFEGGFKVDILLNERPDTNVFCYAIEGAENYDFFYQPPLTDEEIKEGASRPPEIEGSYAVYHKTLKNHQIGRENYATGKVMHIPRPQVWELGNPASTTEWADMTYTEEDGLCVTVRQEFLDSANYPVRVDPTFGYTSVGGTSTNGDNIQYGSKYSLTENATLSSISIYTVAACSACIQVGIFDASINLISGVLSQNTTATSFDTYSFSDSLSIADYYLSMNQNGIRPTYRYDAGATNQTYFKSPVTFGTWASPPTSPTFAARQYSIYATYTASGGGGGGGASTDSGIIWFD